MSTEIATTEEPEAAHLRGVIRRISAILERMREPGSWNLSTEAAVGEIDGACRAAMRRPATNGTVIDQLYRKIGQLEADALDRTCDDKIRRAKAEVQAPPPVVIDLPAAARAFLASLAGTLNMLAEHGATLKPEIVKVWAAKLDAISGSEP